MYYELYVLILQDTKNLQVSAGLQRKILSSILNRMGNRIGAKRL